MNILDLAFSMTLMSLAADIGLLFILNFGLKDLPLLTARAPELLEVTERPATMFKAYLKDFDKHYEGEELLKRFQIFKNSLKENSRMNSKSGATFGLTKFSDMTSEEVIGPTRSYSGDRKKCAPKSKKCGPGPHDGNVPPYHFHKNISERFDWRDVRDRSFVGPVLDQKLCNGCWAFGLVGTMESQAAIKNGQFGPRLSIQELIDCCNATRGCDSGNVVLALHWLCSKEWGVVTEERHPLKLVTQVCHANYEKQKLQVRQFWKICKINERHIPRLVFNHGPVIVVVNASPWRGYMHGVIQGACVRTDDTYDHIVQIVGYDKSPSNGDPPYYIVRNSWGDDFGEKGYVRLAMGGNVCGVRDEAVVLDVYI